MSQYLHDDEQDEKQISKNRLSDFVSFMYLLRSAKKYRLPIAFAIGLMLMNSALGAFSGRLMGYLVENGFAQKNYHQAFLIAAGIVIVEILAISSMWFGRRMLSKNATLTIYSIRRHLFSHLQSLPLSYYDRQPQGRIVTRITHDVEGIEEFFTSTLGNLINALFTAVIFMSAMLLTDFKLGGILILSMLPAFIFIYASRNWVRKSNRAISRFSAKLNAKLSEYLSGIEVIRVFGLEEWTKKNYSHAVDDFTRVSLWANFLFAWTRPVMIFLCTAPIICLVWFGGKGALAGTFSIGVFVTFIRYCEGFFWPIVTLANEMHVVQQAFTNAERVASFLKQDTEEKVLGPDGKIENISLKGELIFNRVSMSYLPEQFILKDVTFHLKPGEKIGFVGPTGCGKSTTVAMLSRLYEYQTGSITLDGIDLRSFKRSFLRTKIGFVSQEVVIFRGTLRENLDPENHASEEQILASCRETGLFFVMEKNQLGLNSEILENGTNLSIGERQLLAFTRILLRNPSLLVLDEATANIDPAYEKILHEAVHRIMVGRTCLIIAHRLETLRTCDRILVMNNGAIAEEGTLDDLISKQGDFANYWSHTALS